jgi:hypothetical protein
MIKYKWQFVANPNLNGPNDAIHEKFRQNAYYSIVRESIQNSMDVPLELDKPVKVKFETITINKAEHPDLFSIEQHIIACLDFFNGDKQAEDLFNGMLDYLNRNDSIKILKVSDYNTKGMKYEEGNPRCPFTSFMSEGISSKGVGSGGSFGFGKGAYYVPSKLRTILVSAKFDNDRVVFQGRTRLSSHDFDGETKDFRGDFRIEPEVPVTDNNQIPLLFRRDEQGTDVYILGMEDDPDFLNKMIVSVLNNFWLAIHQDRLDVVIKTDSEEIEFDEKNLEELIEKYFPSEAELSPISNLYGWNPRSYYKAVKYAKEYADTNDAFAYREEVLPSLGTVRLYVYRKEGLPERISFMRKPAMTVEKVTNRILSDYAAVFVCDNDHGNEILRQMENAAHNEWRPENVRNVPEDQMRVYHDARSQINDFIRRELKLLSGSGSSLKMEVVGLSDFLSIPEELLDDEESVPGLAESKREGISSDNKTEDETGLITTTNARITVKVLPPSTGTAAASAEVGDGDDTIIIGGGPKNDDSNPEPGPSSDPGNQEGFGIENTNSSGLTPISINFRVAATKELGVVFHNIIIQSEKAYNSVLINVKAGTDNGEDLDLKIIETNNGVTNNSSLSEVILQPGKNIIKVRFDDGIKHTLKLNAYEAK